MMILHILQSFKAAGCVSAVIDESCSQPSKQHHDTANPVELCGEVPDPLLVQKCLVQQPRRGYAFTWCYLALSARVLLGAFVLETSNTEKLSIDDPMDPPRLTPWLLMHPRVPDTHLLKLPSSRHPSRISD